MVILCQILKINTIIKLKDHKMILISHFSRLTKFIKKWININLKTKIQMINRELNKLKTFKHKLTVLKNIFLIKKRN